ncbi:MAG: ABC transporter permease [Gammaproteobacteria bacterium]|nr:ABC transporter permease [Gammaproteobacteria bacterium]
MIDSSSGTREATRRETLIEPHRGWSALHLREIWAHRELLLVLTLRDLKVRYKQTVLGVTWAIIQPLFTMLIFSIVFGRFAKIPSDGHPYPLFVYAALLPWVFFANAVSSAGMSLIGSAQLVNKVYLPRIIIPTSTIGSALVDFSVSFAVLLLMLWYFEINLSLSLTLFPLLTLLLVVLALGVGILLAALTVSYRDFRYVVPFALQIWMFATPIVYPMSIIPESWRWLWYLNPMTGIIDGFRACFLHQEVHLGSLWVSLFVSSFVLILGISYFRKVEHRFADVI